MPNSERIAELEAKIIVLRESLTALRVSRRTRRKREKLLGELARLNSERTRLMMKSPLA